MHNDGKDCVGKKSNAGVSELLGVDMCVKIYIPKGKPKKRSKIYIPKHRPKEKE